VRRASILVLLLAGGSAPALRAQVERPAWSIGLLGGLASFRGAGLDTLEAERANARPSGAAGFGLGVTRRWGPWETALEASTLPSHLEVATADVLVREQVASLTRFRLQAMLGRRLATLGATDVVAGVGPTMDRWSYGGDEGRTVWGGEARLTLRHRLGRFSLENVVGFGVSSGPFRADELPPGYERRSLRTLTLGGSLVYGF
jgi:hypothetical protein